MKNSEIILKGELFNTEMVRAIQRDVNPKTNTRRLIKGNPKEVIWNPIILNGQGGFCDEHGKPLKPKYKVGDFMYVRESYWQWGKWHYDDFGEGSKYDNKPRWIGYEMIFVADTNEKPKAPSFPLKDGFWRKIPSLHMKKDWARIYLKVTAVKAERLQDISEADAIAEGVEKNENGTYRDYYVNDIECLYAVHSFKSLWQKINGFGSFHDNPWVWCYSFERCERPA